MKRITFFVIAGSFCFSSMFGSGAQSLKRQTPQPRTSQTQKATTSQIIRPALLGPGLLALGPDVVKKMTVRMEKMDKDSLTPQLIDDWKSALGAAPVESLDSDRRHLALALFVPQVDALYENDQFQPAKLDRLIKRLKRLPREAVSTWKEQFLKIDPFQNETIWLETVGYLVQLDRLFNEDEFKQQKSQTLLIRLRSLSPDAITASKKELDLYPRQAAVMLIQDDLLFKQNQFHEASFSNELQKLKAIIEKYFMSGLPKKN